MNTNNYKLPILYSFRRCPFAIRARAAIYFSNVKVILREVVLKNKPKEMLLVSEKATVPILVLKEKVLDESLEIIIWALSISDKMKLLEPYINQKDRVTELINKFDNSFKFHLDRYKYSSRYNETKGFEGKYIHRDYATSYLIEIESLLKKSKNLYLFNDKLSMVDLCLFPFVRQFRIAEEKWFDSNTNLYFVQQWLLNLVESDFFKGIMRKYIPWNTEKSPEFFSGNFKI